MPTPDDGQRRAGPVGRGRIAAAGACWQAVMATGRVEADGPASEVSRWTGR